MYCIYCIYSFVRACVRAFVRSFVCLFICLFVYLDLYWAGGPGGRWQVQASGEHSGGGGSGGGKEQSSSSTILSTAEALQLLTAARPAQYLYVLQRALTEPGEASKAS
jgi:hypothetical protein